LCRDAYRRFLARDRRQRVLSRMTQLLMLVVVLAGWEIAARCHWVNPLLTSYPSAIWTTFLDLLVSGSLARDTWSTLSATLIGFSISLVLAIAAAAALWWSDFVCRALAPFWVIANAMPKIALVPIFYIWLGAEKSIYGMSVAVAVFVMLMVIHNGFVSINPNQLKLARTFGASRWQQLTKIVLPGSVPSFIAAVKMCMGLCLVGVIVGEFQSADSGLGYMIQNGSQVFKLNVVMTAVAVLALISAALYFCVYALEVALERRMAG